MWETGTHWLDVAVIAGLIAVGSILFGRFEEHKPRWRRLLKAVLGAAVVLGVSVGAGRVWGASLVGLFVAAAAVIHGWWLPRHGVNGWTGEPRDRYLELVGVKRSRQEVRDEIGRSP